MDPKGFLNEAASLIDDRGADYGGIEKNFETIALLAGTVLGYDLRAYDVAIILHCVKLARIRTSPQKRDNYLDGANYIAFAGEMAAPAAPAAPTAPVVSAQPLRGFSPWSANKTEDADLLDQGI